MFSLPGIITSLEQNPMRYALAQEVLGSNVPKTFVVRNVNEGVDVAAGQFGGTIAFFGSGWALNKLLNAAFKRVAGVDLKALANNATARIEQLPDRTLWAVLGKSLAIFAVQGALYWAVPFVRNYATAKRIGAGEFSEVIANKQQNNQPLNTDEQAQKQAKLKAKMAYFKDTATQIVLGGVAVAAAALAFTGLAMNKGWAIGKLKGQFGNKVLSQLALAKGSINNYPKLAQFWFIAVASYAGWIHAVRDKYELKEQLLQFGSFLFGWFVPPVIFDKLFTKKFKKLINDDALTQKVMGVDWNGNAKSSLSLSAITRELADHPKLKAAQGLATRQTVFGLLVSALVLGALPQFINWQLTKRRMSKDGHAGAPGASAIRVDMLPPALPLQQQMRFNQFVGEPAKANAFQQARA